METCAECQNLLWEELFGLLEASASDNLRRHLATCAACQTEMIKAEADQRLLASVARLDVDIPLFTLPAAETIPIAQANEPEGLPALRRSRLGPWLAAAAAVLVCLALPYGLYKRGLSQREFALRQSGEEVEQIDAKQQDLIKAAEGELFAQQAANRQKHMRLQVLGPATYQPGLVSQYRILATDLDGEPRQVELSARLHDGDKRLLFEKSIAGKGELTVSLPPGLIAPSRTRADLEIIAKDSADTVHVREQIDVRDARFITHLTTDRTVYHPGETVFFRSLTLEPFDLRPSGRDFQVAYTLMDPRSARIKPMTGHTRSDGIGGGSFELSASAMPGKYRLTVTDLGGNRFMPVTRTIMVRPRKADEKTGKKGPAQATPQALNVEFFPEGGSLVAGLPNRVYFRVSAANQIAADLAGQVIDSQGREVVAVQTASAQDKNSQAQGLGVFTFTPTKDESYKLRVASSAGTWAVALPAAEAQGIVLSVARSVLKEGEVIPLLLRSSIERDLIVAASCRGSLVAQERVLVKPGDSEVGLRPAAGARGVLRVTVLEFQKKLLQPIAERLIYCAPAERLELTVTADKKNYRPGERVTLTLKSGDEKGQPEQTWLLASVGKQDALSQADGSPRPGLPIAMQFSTSLDQPEDLELAYLGVPDSPEARAVIDLFLATQGWRRIVESGARGGQGTAPSSRDRDSAAVALFALDNLGEAQKRYLQEVEEEVSKARAGLASRLQDLHQGTARQNLSNAARELSEYQKRGRGYARMAIGFGAAATLLLGSAFLIASLVGMARGSLGYRRRLAGAFATLLPCLLSLPLANSLGTIEGHSFDLSRYQAHEGVPEVGGEIIQKAQQGLLARTENRTGGLIAFIHADQGPRVQRPLPKPSGPLPLREYTYELNQKPAGSSVSTDTLLWKPALSVNGETRVSFDLPSEPAIYHVHVEGHSQSGRLGIAELTLEARSSAD